MYTQCPECSTVFQVAGERLQVAGGRVRCGKCRATFDAGKHMVVRVPAAPEPVPPPAPPPPLDDGVNIEALLKPLPDDADEASESHWGDSPPASIIPETPAPPLGDPDSPFEALLEQRLREAAEAGVAPALPGAPETLPAALQPYGPSRRGGPLGALLWGLGCLLLTALLTAQYGYFHRDSLATDARLRPWLERLCAVADCRLPLRRDLSAIQLARRDIRAHDRYRDVLVISGTLVNTAPFPQPYPEVEISLRDLAGHQVASRTFRPSQYLAKPGGVFGPGQQATLHLEVADPGVQAVGFEFSFH